MGKTVDELWDDAIKPVQLLFNTVYDPKRPETLQKAYKKVFLEYDKYSLDSYFREVANWSDDCVRLYDLGSAHVVLDNGFIESWKDSFLSSNDQGQAAGMQQMKEVGSDAIAEAQTASLFWSCPTIWWANPGGL
jgi:monoamine oxidase